MVRFHRSSVVRLNAHRRGRSASRFLKPVMVLVGAAFVGAMIGIAPAIELPSVAPGYSDTISGCRITDGDTVRCGDERIRLLGIDAPELPGHCRVGRDCAPGDPYASSRSLREALVGKLKIERVGEDHYGRTLATMAGDRGDLSCWQLVHDQAIYVARWDNGKRVARTCPGAILN